MSLVVNIFLLFLSVHFVYDFISFFLLFASVYDKNRHLTAFDTGLLEKNKELYVSGFVKPVYEENPSYEGDLETDDVHVGCLCWCCIFLHH